MGKYSFVDIMRFVARYLWIFCSILILIDLCGSIYTAKILVERNAQEILSSAKAEIENRIDMTWRMVDSLSAVKSLTDNSVPLLERRELLPPYAEKFNLFMVAITDEKGNVTSSARVSIGDVSKKDWFQNALHTKKGGVTNIFPAGLDNTTKQFTIYVPILQDSEVVGTIFGSISLAEINQIILDRSRNDVYCFFLYDNNNVIQAHPNPNLVNKNLDEVRNIGFFWSSISKDELKEQFVHKETGGFWTYSLGKIEYVMYVPIERTDWQLLVRADIIRNSIPVIWLFFFKMLVIIFLFKILEFFGTKTLREKFRPIGNVIQEVHKIQTKMMSMEGGDQTDITSILQVSQQGLTDQLTGLPTRIMFTQQINAVLARTGADQISGLFFIDMDGLKKINDTYGHAHGDAALKYLADTLKKLAENHPSLITRYGGDEFLLYVLSVETSNDLAQIAEKILNQFRKPLYVDGACLAVRVSIGIAVYPAQADSIEKLIQLADQALYKAKAEGKDCFIFYKE